ncbi:MAG: aminotransferase class I/II-fold pyridoxal phosphate-dependent enzyme, partial [Arenimonas sp.]
KYPNLIVTRTFSKAYGLAGLRVGYACAHPGLLSVLERVRESFNVNCLGLAACTAAVADQQHVETVRGRNAAERDWLAAQLRGRGLAVAPSQTNFLLLDFGRDAGALENQLLQRGVVLRPMGGYGLPDCLRATVGFREESMRLLACLDEVRT